MAKVAADATTSQQTILFDALHLEQIDLIIPQGTPVLPADGVSLGQGGDVAMKRNESKSSLAAAAHGPSEVIPPQNAPVVVVSKDEL